MGIKTKRHQQRRWQSTFGSMNMEDIFERQCFKVILVCFDFFLALINGALIFSSESKANGNENHVSTESLGSSTDSCFNRWMPCIRCSVELDTRPRRYKRSNKLKHFWVHFLFAWASRSPLAWMSRLPLPEQTSSMASGFAVCWWCLARGGAVHSLGWNECFYNCVYNVSGDYCLSFILIHDPLR